MTTLVTGASGATGKHLVTQLLKMGQEVKAMVRSTANIPDSWQQNDQLTIIEAGIADASVDEMASYLKDCQSVVSCLGHNLNLKGIYGKPRRLVANAVRLTCQAIETNAPEKPVKFVLMNTTANKNRDLKEHRSLGEKIVIGLIRVLMPPQPDNEKAAEYLRLQIGQQHPFVEWVAVRPDSLIDRNEVNDYELHPSPIRSAVFNPGKTSRINAAHFMARLIKDDGLWRSWKGQMPVVYNVEHK